MRRRAYKQPSIVNNGAGEHGILKPGNTASVIKTGLGAFEALPAELYHSFLPAGSTWVSGSS